MLQYILDTLKTRSVIPEAYAQRILTTQDIHALDDAGRSIIDYIVEGTWINPADTTQDAPFLALLKKSIQDVGGNTDATSVIDFEALIKNRDASFIENLWQTSWININNPDKNGNFLFASARQSNNKDLVSKLLQIPNLLVDAKSGTTAFMMAVQLADLTLIESHLNNKNNVDINLKDSDGHSVFYHAKGNPKILSLLERYRSTQAASAPGPTPASTPPLTQGEKAELNKKMQSTLLSIKNTMILGSGNKQFDLEKTDLWSIKSLSNLRKESSYKKNVAGKWNLEISNEDKTHTVNPLLKEDPLKTLPLFKDAPLLSGLIQESIAYQNERVGNCGELSFFAAAQLWRNAGTTIKRIETVSGKEFDHAWVIINRKPGTSLLNPKEWSEDCWIFDPWLGEKGSYYPASEFHEKILETIKFLIDNYDWITQNTPITTDTTEAKKVYERYLEAFKNNTLEIPINVSIDIDTQILPYPTLEANMSLENYYRLEPSHLKPGKTIDNLITKHKTRFEKSKDTLKTAPDLATFSQTPAAMEKKIGDALMINLLEKNNIITAAFAQNLLDTHHINMVEDTDGRNLLHLLTLRKWHTQEIGDILSNLLNRKYFNINQEDKQGKTALHNAILKENVEAVKVLSQHPSIHINKIDNYSMTYLVHALNNITIFKTLLQNKSIDLNVTDKFGHTILHHLIKKGDTIFIRALLQNPDIDIAKRFNINAVDKKGRNIWQYAANHGNAATNKILQDTFPLEHAIETKNIEKIKNYFITHPTVKPNTVFDFHAVTKSMPALLENLMLNNLLEPNAKDKNGVYLLEIAIQYQSKTLLDHLLKQKNIDINVNDGMPLRTAWLHKNISAIDLLLQHDNTQLKMPMVYALLVNQFEGFLPLLLKAKNTDLSPITLNATIDGDTFKDFTLLMLAVAVNKSEHVKLLLTASKVNLNAQRDDGQTALHMAVLKDNITIVNTLLNCTEGIDLDIKDKAGKSVFDYAQGKPEILKALQGKQNQLAAGAPSAAPSRPQPVVSSYNAQKPQENTNASSATVDKNTANDNTKPILKK